MLNLLNHNQELFGRVYYYTSFVFFFLIVFQFKVPFLYNSLVLSILILLPLLFLILSLKRFKWSFDRAVSIVFILFLFYFLFLAFLTFLTFFVVNEGDYYRLKTILSNVVSLVVLFVFLKVYEKFISFEYLCKLVINVFFIQSVIIIASILSPDFRDLISVFKSESDLDIAEKYGGVRGNALAGSQFFPMSACFAFAQLFCIAYVLESKCSKINYFFIIKFLCIVIAGLSVGRTSIVGTFFSFILLTLSLNTISSRSFFFKFLLLITCLTVLITPLIVRYDLIETVERFSEFAFEFIYNYINGDGVTTQSTDILDKMYFSIPIQNLIYGYGRYIESNLIYPFLRTDAGYMRDVIHFGLLGLIITFLMPINAFYLYFNKRSKYQAQSRLLRKNLYLLWFIALSLIFVLHYKGLVILNLVSFNILFTIFTVATIKQSEGVR